MNSLLQDRLNEAVALAWCYHPMGGMSSVGILSHPCDPRGEWVGFASWSVCTRVQTEAHETVENAVLDLIFLLSEPRRGKEATA